MSTPTALHAKTPARIVVLVSGAGTNMQALLEACRDEAYGADVVAVGADRERASGLRIAEAASIPTFVRELRSFPTREHWNASMRHAVASYRPDIVVLAGFLKLLSDDFLEAFPYRVINTHNSLLPSFPGIDAPAQALAHGVKVTGATLFVVDSGTDTGAILAQATCPVLPADTEDSLLERIKGIERQQLVEAVGDMARRGWWVDGRQAGIGEWKGNDVRA
ncbi:MAG: phosphoribosylglycinamide formyltransferase [Actinomycetaceae bacterium]|nr:phosphoribosylglycinamide formyltransferase [Actinomycetaceae bacterium]